MNYIPLNKCKHGFGYWINSRNLSYGVFDEKRKTFIGIRFKFGDKFLDNEIHHDADTNFGTAYPIREDVKCPIENLEETNGHYCEKENRELRFDIKTNEYIHIDDGSIKDESCGWPIARSNKKLFDWIQSKFDTLA